MRIFSKYSPSLTIPAFKAFMALVMLLRFLFGTMFGFLITVIILYVASSHIFGIQPMDPREFINWFIMLPEPYKVASMSASLTVLGFIVAFHTATINWKNELKAQIKKNSAGEVEEFFNTVGRLISDAEIYIQSLISAVNKINSNGNNEAKFEVDWAIAGIQKFLSTRDQISQALVQVHTLKGRNFTILTSVWGLPGTLDKAISMLNEIGSKIWITVPIIDSTHPNYINHFYESVNIGECNEFLNAADQLTGPMLMLSGSIKGALLAPIMGLNWPMFFHLFSDRKGFRHAIKDFYSATSQKR